MMICINIYIYTYICIYLFVLFYVAFHICPIEIIDLCMEMVFGSVFYVGGTTKLTFLWFETVTWCCLNCSSGKSKNIIARLQDDSSMIKHTSSAFISEKAGPIGPSGGGFWSNHQQLLFGHRPADCGLRAVEAGAGQEAGATATAGI